MAAPTRGSVSVPLRGALVYADKKMPPVLPARRAVPGLAGVFDKDAESFRNSRSSCSSMCFIRVFVQVNTSGHTVAFFLTIRLVVNPGWLGSRVGSGPGSGSGSVGGV